MPKEVVISVVENDSTRANLLLSGELNIASVPGPDGERVAAQLKPISEISMLSGGFVYSQAEGMPTADKNVRIALTKALDLDALMKVQTSDKGERAQRLAVTPPQICKYDAATPNLPGTDVAEAEAMLDAAGWTKGADGIRAKDGQPLVLDFAWHTRLTENAATAEMIGQQWAEIGVRVNQDGSDFGVFNEKVNAEGASSVFDVMWSAPNYPVPNVPVSYTHLDVYKRQDEPRARSRERGDPRPDWAQRLSRRCGVVAARYRDFDDPCERQHGYRRADDQSRRRSHQ